ncbi:MAG: phage major tail tube protein [Candidatus Sericytochromatia bacterium]|nr:phage major tail tube protein [Candidatus Sericytochromatia bacterium]
MSDKIQINRFTNANVYIDGNSLMGQVAEIELPDIKTKMSEHKALGMIGAMELPSGIDKLAGKIKWTAFYPDALKRFAHPHKTIQLQVRGSLESYQPQGIASEVPVVAVLTIMSQNLPKAAIKPQDNVELDTDYSAYYYKLTINGEDIVEIDLFANIHKVGGVDILENYRNNLGG